jgi:hypothetical protein
VNESLRPAGYGRSVPSRHDVQNGSLLLNARSHSTHALALLRRVLATGGMLLASRRWLVGALVATCALMGVLSLGKPKHLLLPQAPPPIPETKFDDVTNLNNASGSWLHRWTEAANNARKAANAVPDITLGVSPDDEGEPPESSRVTRRLDAVRSRKGKGAFLTGSIDSVKPTARQYSNAPLHPPAHVALPPAQTQTVDSHNDTLHGTADSAFR